MRKNVRKLEALLLAGAMAVTTAGCMPTSKSQDSAGGQSAQESSTAQNTGETAAAADLGGGYPDTYYFEIKLVGRGFQKSGYTGSY